MGRQKRSAQDSPDADDLNAAHKRSKHSAQPSDEHTKNGEIAQAKPQHGNQPATGTEVAHGPVGDGTRVGSFTVLLEVTAPENAGSGRELANSTTHEVDYNAISLGKKMKWFMEEMEGLSEEGTDFPHLSHGFSAPLANIHRGHPKMAYAWETTTDEDTEVKVELFGITSWESAGIWVDTAKETCLVIWAEFEDGASCMRLLYESERKDFKKDITQPGQWIVLDRGKGGHLRQADGYIICNEEPLGPKESRKR